jgi:hypothetical protein
MSSNRSTGNEIVTFVFYIIGCSHFALSDIQVKTLMWPCLRPRYGIITVGTSGITNQSAVFDPHPDVGPVYKKTKRLLLRGASLTQDQGNYIF